MLHHEGFVCVFTQPSLLVCLPLCPGHWSNQLLSSLKPVTMKCLSARWTCVCIQYVHVCLSIQAEACTPLKAATCSQHLRELLANSGWIYRHAAGVTYRLTILSLVLWLYLRWNDTMPATIYSTLWQIKIYMTPTGQGCCMNPSPVFDKRHQWAVFSSLQLKWLIISRTSAVVIH